jgi:hypothetical protein
MGEGSLFAYYLLGGAARISTGNTIKPGICLMATLLSRAFLKRDPDLRIMVFIV